MRDAGNDFEESFNHGSTPIDTDGEKSQTRIARMSANFLGDNFANEVMRLKAAQCSIKLPTFATGIPCAVTEGFYGYWEVANVALS